ncbi:hypothetical protein EV424DRAFT_1350632 [Suillus variegatus]|nr:hypothetical protein EV424DRAFT_1350632 [Suillus variegatus]
MSAYTYTATIWGLTFFWLCGNSECHVVPTIVRQTVASGTEASAFNLHSLFLTNPRGYSQWDRVSMSSPMRILPRVSFNAGVSNLDDGVGLRERGRSWYSNINIQVESPRSHWDPGQFYHTQADYHLTKFNTKSSSKMFVLILLSPGVHESSV